MSVFFSKSSLGFFPSEWLEDGTYTKETWPGDAVSLSCDEISTYWKVSAPTGKKLSANKSGRPCWVEKPKLSKIREIEITLKIKEMLIDEVEKMIKPLERARAHGMATKDELKMLSSLEVYSVKLMRIRGESFDKVHWPTKPNF